MIRSKWIEENLPLISFLISLTFLIIIKFGGNNLFDKYIPQNIISLLSNDLLVLLSIGIGFFISSLTFLLSISSTKSVITLKSSGAYKDVIRLYIRAVKWSLWALALTLFVRINFTANIFDFYGYKLDVIFMFSLGIASLVAWYIVTKIFVLLVQAL